MAALDVEIEETPQNVVVRLIGNAGTVESDRLQTALTRLMARRPALVVVDLAKLVFLASLAMGVLVSFRRSLVRNGGQLQLTAIPPLILAAFRSARLDQLFDLPATN